MAKKIISIILSVLMISSVMSVIGISASAEATVEYVYEVIDGKATINICLMNNDGRYSLPRMSNLVIPETIDGYTVNAISDQAFTMCVAVEAITIPATVETIGDGAFADCVSLKSITVLSKTVDLDASHIGYSMYDVHDGMLNEFVETFNVYFEEMMKQEEAGPDYNGDSVMLAWIKLFDYAERVSDETAKIDGLTISGYTGSTAEAYAEANGFAFSALAEETKEPETDTEVPEDSEDNSESNVFIDLLVKIFGKPIAKIIIKFFIKLLAIFNF